MKTLDVEKMANELFKQHGLENWRFAFDRATSRFGACKPMRRLITLSRVLVELNEPERVKLTLLHEIAHALTVGDHHGTKWRAVLLSIGGDGERCYSVANTVTPERKPRLSSYRIYTADCACGTHRRRQRLRNRICAGCRQSLTFYEA